MISATSETMIYGTSETEVREIKRLENLRIVPGLEEWTGADLMISPLSIPVTEALLKRHLQHGAILVQIKRGHDLVSSILDHRLHGSLAKMRDAGARQSQCLLLFIGSLYNANGEAVINGSKIHMSGDNTYWYVYSALSKWWKRGGVVEILPKFSEMPDWCVMTDTHIRDMSEHRHVADYPDDSLYMTEDDDPLQELVLIKDWRRTLASIPGLGPARISALYKYMQSLPASSMTLAQALYILTTPEFAKEAGIGPSLVSNVRRWLGIDEGMELTVTLETHDTGTAKEK